MFEQIKAMIDESKRYAAAGILFVASTALASPLTEQTAGTWVEFPASNLEDVAPNPSASGNLDAVVFAWSGGVFDTDRDQLIVWGGGHTDYSGNEVYAFGPMAGGDPSWSRLTNPTLPPAKNVNRGTDGRPVSRHTYNLIDYLPAPHNRMMSCAVGSQYQNGYSTAGVDFFDFEDLQAGQEPWSPGPNPPQTSNAYEAFCVYDAVTDSVWFHDTGKNASRLMRYDLANNSWSAHVKNNFPEDQTAAIDPVRHLLVSVGEGKVRVWDLDNPGASAVIVTTAGPQTVENGKAPGFVYDPVNDQFVGWHNSDSVYTLSIPTDPQGGTWQWNQVPLDASNQITPTQVAGIRQAGYITGTYGRFRYVPSAHGVVLVNAVDENVFFFKLPDNGGQPPPTATLVTSSSSVNMNGSTTLSWSSQNASACEASDGWSGSKSLSGSETIGPLTTDTTFVLACTASTGAGVVRSVTVQVLTPTPTPTVSLDANPTSVDSGGFSTLGWTSSNASGCEATGGWSGPKSPTGSESVGPLQSQQVYALTCSGPGGSTSDSVTVSIANNAPSPTISLSASPTSVTSGSGTTLNWTSDNASSCTASGAWSGTKALSGSQSSGTLSSTAQFSLICSGEGGSVSQSVTVSVNAAPAPSSGDADTESSGGGATGPLGLLSLFALTILARIRTRSRQFAAVTASALMASSALAAPVTTLMVQNLDNESKSEVPITFGHTFVPGEVEAGQSLVATRADGLAIPLQVDKKAAHADGSLRHAILTLRVPTLGAGANDAVTLATDAGAASGASVTAADLLATDFDTQVTIDINGALYTASARDALAGASQWLNGAIVSEWIGGGPIQNASGDEHPHLAVYFHVRAFAGEPVSRARVDVVFENNWAFVPGAQNRAYDVTITVPGAPSSQVSLTHWSRARWHQVAWWGGDPNVHAKLDHDYLQSTRAIPRYEDVQPTESFLNGVRQSTAPMENGDHSDDMDATGYQQGIGPLPRWDAIYAVTADVRALRYMLANADGGGAYSIHIRDELTGLPITIDDHPNTSLIDPVGSNPAMPNPSSDSPYDPGSGASHQPSIGYLAYLVTGDYFYLEEAHFWSAYNLIWTSVNNRSQTEGWWYTGSLRGQAWAYRSLAQSAYITPDSHPLKGYFVEKLNNNIDNDSAKYVNPGNSANNLGAMYMKEGNEQYRFYDYFMSWTMQYLVDLGFTNAVPLRDYKIQFPIGLMGDDDSGFCFQSAPRYTWKIGPGGTSIFYSDWSTVYENTAASVASLSCGSAAMSSALDVPANGMIGGQDSATYWFANLQPALAAAFDSGVSGGAQAWNLSRASGVTPDYKNNPIWAVVPHNQGSPQLSVGISANPTSVQPGGSTTLSWTSQNADTCSASGDWAGNKSAAGSETVIGIDQNATFTLTCQSNSLGTRSDSAVVTVSSAPPPPPPPQAPSLSFTSDSSSVESGASVQLSWSSENATSCSASGGWSGSKPLDGSETMSNITSNQTFELNCSGDGGDVSRSLSVTVSASSGSGGSGGGSGGGSSGDDESGGGGAVMPLWLLLLGFAFAFRQRSAMRRCDS
ncbi:MAG: hypothetical protein AAF545_05190 [Pseudomonadota bacterium]